MGKQISNESFNKDDVGDKLYIYYKTQIKCLPGRLGYLYKYLVESITGYYMKFGSKQSQSTLSKLFFNYTKNK